MTITRAPGPVAVDGVRAPSLAALRAALGDEAVAGCAAVDLTLGAWRGCAAARELCEQLGLPAPSLHEGLGVQALTADSPSYAPAIGRLIDAETRGDRLWLAAVEQATAVCAALRERPRTVMVLAPRFRETWEPEDLAFLRVLAHGLRGEESRLVLVATGHDAVVPDAFDVSWAEPEAAPAPAAAKPALAALVPGVLSPAVGRSLPTEGLVAGADFVALGGGCLLIDPALRRDPAAVPRLEHDRLAVQVADPRWVRTYAVYRGHNVYVDADRMASEADARFVEGGAEIALRLLDRAAECAETPIGRAVCELWRQAMRIVLERFADAAAAPDPQPSLPDALRGALMRNKAWGLVMTHRAAEAEPLFAGADALLAPSYGDTDDHLYLMNIHALNRLRLGDRDGALELELAIRQRLEALEEPNSQLEYVNGLNIARLLTRRGELEEAAASYERGFATTDGLRSDADLVYQEVCRAKLYDARERPREALEAWLRAAVAWLASDVPEALPARAARALVPGPPRRGPEMADAVSASLAERLADAAERAGAAVAHVPVPAVLARLDAVAVDAADGLVLAGSAGWGVGVLRRREPVQLAGAATDGLRALVHGILAASSPALDAESAGTLLVDDRSGRGIARTAAQLAETAARAPAVRIVFDGAEIALEAAARDELAAAMTVEIGPAVARLGVHEDTVVAFFRRTLPPLVLSPGEGALVLAVATGEARTVAELGSDRARALERSRALALSVPAPVLDRAANAIVNGELKL